MPTTGLDQGALLALARPLGASSAWLPWLRPSAHDKHQLPAPPLQVGRGLAKRSRQLGAERGRFQPFPAPVAQTYRRGPHG